MIEKLLKRRKLDMKTRVYLQDSVLNETVFTPGQHIQVNCSADKIEIVPADKGIKVCKRKLKTLEKPVIDLRGKSIIKFLKNAIAEVQFYTTHIVIVLQQKIISINSKRKELIANAIYLSKKKVVGEQLSLFDQPIGQNTQTISTSFLHENKISVLSLCSGAGIMDYAFKQQGFHIVKALELMAAPCKTYRRNLGEAIQQQDISTIDLEDLPDVQVIIAGTPCQDFSPVNPKQGKFSILDSPKNQLVRKFIDIVNHTKSCKVAILENVPQILTKGKAFFEELKERLKGFHVSAQQVNAMHYGTPQSRERAIIVASKVGPINITPPPLKVLKTVREAFKGLTEKIANQLDYSKPKEATKAIMAQIKPNRNLKSLNTNNEKIHSNRYKRLSWDTVSCTIVNVRKALILHPEENRVLSVRECARLFDLPDNFIFEGTLGEKQQQIANGVPVKMMKYIAMQVKKALSY